MNLSTVAVALGVIAGVVLLGKRKKKKPAEIKEHTEYKGDKKSK